MAVNLHILMITGQPAAHACSAHCQATFARKWCAVGVGYFLPRTSVRWPLSGCIAQADKVNAAINTADPK